MRYKVDFGFSFLLCILIMPLNEIWRFLEKRPEAFPYGNEIYHALAIIFFIFSNFAVGVSAAIVFYFMQQFINKKKDFEIYADLRSDTYRLLYNHIEILKEIPGFEHLKKKDAPYWFLITDVQPLLDSFYAIDTKEKKTQFKGHLKTYFSKTSPETLHKIMDKFEENIKILDSKKETRYFKHSKDLIESITAMFGYSGDFSITFELYVREKKKIINVII
jgi:hypothetical protein